MAIYKSLVKKISVSPDMKTKQKEYLEQGELAIVDQGQKLIGGYSDDIRKKVNCKLPVIVFGDHTRAVKLITFPFGAGADGTKILEPSDDIYSKYLFYGTKYLVIKMPDKGYARHYQHLEKMDLPLPSLDEQKRIVAQIEELFSELDNAEATLQATKQQLAAYRQAVLSEAFEGDYEKKSLSEISTAISGYAFKSKKYSPEGEYVVVKIGNVKQWRFDFSRDLTKTTEATDEILNKYLLKRGDCLLSLTGSRGKRDYGFVAMIEDEDNFLVNQRVAALRFDKEVALSEFYKYYLSSPLYRNQFFKYETGNVGQGNVGIKALQEPIVKCPPLEIQKRIVDDVEARISACDAIEQTVDTTLLQLQSMRQSVLKEAFEGRL